MIVLLRVLSFFKSNIKNFYNLMFVNLSFIILNKNRACQRIGFIVVHSQGAHKLALYGQTQLLFSIESRILEANPAREFVFDLPRGKEFSVTEYH